MRKIVALILGVVFGLLVVRVGVFGTIVRNRDRAIQTQETIAAARELDLQARRHESGNPNEEWRHAVYTYRPKDLPQQVELQLTWKVTESLAGGFQWFTHGDLEIVEGTTAIQSSLGEERNAVIQETMDASEAISFEPGEVITVTGLANLGYGGEDVAAAEKRLVARILSYDGDGKTTEVGKTSVLFETHAWDLSWTFATAATSLLGFVVFLGLMSLFDKREKRRD